MKNIFTLFFLFIITTFTSAQNLVPNGDFEQYIACPASFAQIDSSYYWTCPTSNVSTDYFNTCAPLSSLVGVPVNQGTGYQYPHSGNAYGGLFISFLYIADTREYIEVPLTSPLQAGQCYHLEMYVNILNGCGNSSDAIGAYFSDTLLSGLPPGVLPFTPQIVNQAGNMFDTLNWVLVQGNFTAAGGEQYMIMGNFKNDAQTTVTNFYPLGANMTYVYIDDVSLTVCTGINDVSSAVTNVSLYPNPFTDMLTVTTDHNQSAEIILFDITSRQLMRQSFSGSVSLNTKHLASGTYLYKVQNKNGVLKTGKIIKD